MKKCFLPFLLLSVWLFCAQLCAQQSDTLIAKTKLHEQIVKGRSTRTDYRTATPTFTLDSLALLRRGLTSTADALRHLPGVNLRDYGGAGGLKTISVRGLGAAHTSVVVDGLPVGASQNGQVDFSRFPLSQLSSLGLSIGDGSQLLMPVSALGAATVFLHSPTNMRQFSVKVGTFGTYAGQLSWKKRWRSTHIFVHSNGEQSQNKYPFLLKNIQLLTQEYRHHNRLKRAYTQIGLQHDFTDSLQVRFSGKLYGYWQELPGQVQLYTHNAHEELWGKENTLQLHLTQKKKHWNWQIAGKHTWSKQTYEDWDGRYPNAYLNQSYRQTQEYLTAGIEWKWLPNTTMAWSNDVERTQLHSNLNVDNDVTRRALLTALSIRHKWKRLTFTVRFLGQYYHDQIDSTATLRTTFPWQIGEKPQPVSQVTPSLTCLWHIQQDTQTQTYLRAHYRESFRMPSFSESYYYRAGNVRLRPELAQQWGIGITRLRQSITPRWSQLSLSADFYYNKVRDRIVSIPLSTYLWRTLNMGRIDAIGADFNLESTHTLSKTQKAYANLSYSWQNVTDRSETATDTYGKQIAYSPQHTAAVAVTWENPWINCVINAFFVSTRWANHAHYLGTDMPPYAEMGFTVYKTLHIHKQPIDLRVTVSNLLNHQYEVIYRYPMPGRAGQMQLTWHF